MLCLTLVGLSACQRAKDQPVAVVAAAPAEDAPAEPKAPADPHAAAKATSADNLRRLAEAMHRYHDKHGALPVAALGGKDGQPLLSWRVLLLPFLGEEKLFAEFKLDEPWDSAHNKPLLERMPAAFGSGRGDAAGRFHTHFQVFAGGLAPFHDRGAPRPARGQRLDRFRNGTSNVFLIVEAGEAVPWTKPADLHYTRTAPDLKPDTRLPKLDGPFADGFLAAFADTRVFWIERQIPETDLHNYITPSVWIPPLRQAHRTPFVFRDAQGEVLHTGKRVRDWLAALKGPEGPARQEAVQVLRHLNADDAAWLPELTRALQDKELVVNARWVEKPYAKPVDISPGKSTAPAKERPAEPVAVKPEVGSSTVVRAIARMGAKGQRILLEALSHPDAEVRQEVVAVVSRATLPGYGAPWPVWHDRAALLKLGPALQPVFQEWLRDRFEWSERAFLVLGLLAPDAEWAVPMLREVMKEPPPAPEMLLTPGVQRNRPFLAALVLTRYRGQAETAVPFLLESLKPFKDVQFGARAPVGGFMGEQAYWAIRRLGAEAVPLVLPALKHDSEVVRAAAVRVLGSQPPQPEKLLPLFKEALTDKSYVVKREAVTALEAYGAAAVEPLLAVLQGKELGSSVLRFDLMDALGRLGPHAKAAVPTLVERTKRKDPSDQEHAARAICRIERRPDRLLPLLVERFERGDYPNWVFPILREMEPEGQATFVALLEKMREKPINANAGAYATAALRRIKDEAAHWAEQLKQPNGPLQLQAMRELVQIGPPAKAAGPRLRELLQGTPSPAVRGLAALALWRVEKNKEEALAALQPLLDRQHSAGHAHAARLLWEVNRRPDEVLALLVPGYAMTWQPFFAVQESPDGPREAALLLAEMGAAARPAWPMLYHAFLRVPAAFESYQPGAITASAAVAMALEKIE